MVAVEEMLHLTLAANLLNAIGGTTRPDRPGFRAALSRHAPRRRGRLHRSISSRFSKQAIETFLKIERPADGGDRDQAHAAEPAVRRATAFATVPGTPDLNFYSIGEFYEEILRGLDYVCTSNGRRDVHAATPPRQVTAEYYYSGGGKLFPVTDLGSAEEAMQLIVEPGRGLGPAVSTTTRASSRTTTASSNSSSASTTRPATRRATPTGPPVKVDWDAVYPIKTNASSATTPEGRELHARRRGLQRRLRQFPRPADQALQRQAGKLFLDEAVPKMFRISNRINQLMRNPIPGWLGVNAAPTFEVGASRRR